MEIIIRVKYLVYKLLGGKDTFRRFSSNTIIKYLKRNRIQMLVKEDLNKKEDLWKRK